MSYGSKSWEEWVLEEKDGIEHIKAAFAAGVNVSERDLFGRSYNTEWNPIFQTFDTANVYSRGESERILGKAIKEIGAPRSSFVILTKVYAPMLPDNVPKEAFRSPEQYGLVNIRGLSRKHIFDSIKASLERLQLEYVDVLQCHRFDAETPIEETMQALHDVVQAGYARYIGMSSCAAWQFHLMQSKLPWDLSTIH
jgi:aryl-alcohol dehydrogenase-like predicted oxidoreductase